MQKILRYENGLRVSVDTIPFFNSVATGIYVGMGSSLESADVNGLSHFTEHVMFKGTDKLDAYGIADAFESYGAHVNAFTGREATCYYVKSTDEYSEECFGLLCHIFYDSLFSDAELDKERGVVIEEINMVEDEPDEICSDLIASALYGDRALGQTILGPIDNVKRFNNRSVTEFVKKHYCASNTVISFAGNITPEKADELVKKYVLPKICENKTGGGSVGKVKVKKTHKERILDFEQSNIILAFPSLPFGSDRLSVQSVVNVVTGGGMSSRLFQSVRERLGLAYSVYSTPFSYKNNGSFNICLNISPENTAKALKATADEIKKMLHGGITDNELNRAKIQLKSALAFGRESVQSVMLSNGKLLLLLDSLNDHAARIAEINAVTASDAGKLIKDTFLQGSFCSAYVGRKYDADFGEILT
jgi:predicted Zn-dependent peptidase